jgi:hypothetical protein
MKTYETYFYLRGVRHRCPILNENGVAEVATDLGPHETYEPYETL